MSKSVHARRWSWLAGLGLGLAVVAVICVLLIPRNRASLDSSELENSESSAVVPATHPTIEPAGAVVETLPNLPRVDFPLGSWEEACGLNELPPYWVGVGSIERNEDHTNALESVECQTALETYMNTVNPYHFLWSSPWDIARPMKFVELDDPLTFESVFANPSADLARMQNALSRPECLLTGDDINWELKVSCHSNSLLNYVLINVLCFGRFSKVVRENHAYYPPEDNPTSEQDRLMWKQDFEDTWVDAKCESVDPVLKLDTDRYPSLYELVKPVGKFESEERKILTVLVELAARLGDDTAGLTQSFPFNNLPGNGYKYGRFSKIFVGGGFESLREAGATMRMYKPSDEPAELLLKAFHFLTLLEARRPDPREEIPFNWEWVVRHICVPVVIPPSTTEGMAAPKPTEIQSCKEIVHELRQRDDLKFAPLLQTLDKFEQIALELGVYE